MSPHQRYAFALLDALIRDDADALHEVLGKVEANDCATLVLGTVSALFISALISVQGEAGALALLDQAQAEHAAGWSS